MSDTRLPRLAALAAALCRVPDVRIAVDPERWSYLPDLRELRVSARDLGRRSDDACRGAIAHEVARAEISRSHELALPHFPDEDLARALLNVLEDARVDLWIGERFPRAVEWIDALHAEDAEDAEDAEELDPRRIRTDFQALLAGVLLERTPAATAMRLLAGLPPAARAALEETRDARCRYACTLPPRGRVPADGGAPLEEWSAIVGPLLAAPARGERELVSHDERERLIRAAAARALRIAAEEIFPVAARLVNRR